MDPYRIADVYIPWLDALEEVMFDAEPEWLDRGEPDQLVARGMSNEARRRVGRYLSMNGAAVWARIERAKDDADRSHEANPGAGIVSAVTASELTVRFMILRPLIAGLVFNTRFAMILVRHGQTGRTDLDRALLPHVCAAWDIDLKSLSLENDEPLWETFLRVVEVRNHYVHRADPVSPEHTMGALACSNALIDQVLVPLTGLVGLPWPPTGWTHNGRTHDPVDSPYDYMGS